MSQYRIRRPWEEDPAKFVTFVVGLSPRSMVYAGIALFLVLFWGGAIYLASCLVSYLGF
jgi:hypothetical protein